MPERYAIELRVELPRALAAEVEEVQRRDPDQLSRLLEYMWMRRTIYHHLRESALNVGER